MKLDAIQQALRQEGLDGWLFYDHHRRDPLAYRILSLGPASPTRRWYYFIPAQGEPRGLTHRIEPRSLESLPGERIPYSRWSEQRDGLVRLLGGAKRVAMQHSPMCAIPYVAMVDGGTVELISSLGVDIVSSANLVQLFEATWSAEQFEMHLEAGRRVDAIRRAAFDHIGERLRAGEPVNEYGVQQFILKRFEAEDLFTDHGPIVGVNANAADPHYEPTREVNAPIQWGDLVLIDLWAKLKRPGAVYYDVTWTGVCAATATDRVQQVFRTVTGARDAAIARVQQAIAAGQPLMGFEVDDAARGFIEQAGFGDAFVHRTGHSIGEDVHGSGANMDNLETHDVRRVIPNTCFSIEPGVYLAAEGIGIRSEINLFITAAEARVTGEIQRELVHVTN